MQDINYEYAGFWIRLVAMIVDSILLCMVVFPILLYTYGWDYMTNDSLGPVAGVVDLLLNWIFPGVVTAWFWMAKQSTPGKMLFSMKVLDAKTGNALTLWQAVGRYLAYIPASIILGMGLLMVAFDKKKQGMHDKLAGTVVVMSKTKA